jgi:hypothetical protein
MSDIVKKYHEYYYDVKLSNSEVIPLPFDIPNIDIDSLKQRKSNNDILKVIWLGRFEYFKNPAIKKVYSALSNLANKYKYMKIEFDLIGYGRKKYEKDIRKNVKTDNRLEVNYLGKIPPNKLPEILVQYDVGVAMGTSALHIASMRIPTIYLDASDENHFDDIKGCWLHNEPIGLGSGIYADIAGIRIKGRKKLKELFQEIILNPELKENYGVLDRSYVLENHDENKNMPQIIDAWTSSTFTPNDMIIYRHPPIERFIRRIAIKMLK